jgi:hypothetical protein
VAHTTQPARGDRETRLTRLCFVRPARLGGDLHVMFTSLSVWAIHTQRLKYSAGKDSTGMRSKQIQRYSTTLVAAVARTINISREVPTCHSVSFSISLPYRSHAPVVFRGTSQQFWRTILHAE